LSVRDFSAYSPQVFDGTGLPEFDILVRLTGIALGMGADVDSNQLAGASLMTAVQEAVSDPGSPIAGRDPAEILALLGDRPWPERFLDLMLRLGHRGDGFGANPDGLSLSQLEANPHGIDFGPLIPRLTDILVTTSGKVDLVPDGIAADLPRLLDEVGRVPGEELLLIGRRQLRSANSWLHNIDVLMKGKERCTLQINPDDASRLGVVNGASVAVASTTGRVELSAEVTADISRGVVSVAYGWGDNLPGSRVAVAAARPGVNSDILTDSGSIDPLSGNAVLNGIPVTVTAFTRS